MAVLGKYVAVGMLHAHHLGLVVGFFLRRAHHVAPPRLCSKRVCLVLFGMFVGCHLVVLYKDVLVMVAIKGRHCVVNALERVVETRCRLCVKVFRVGAYILLCVGLLSRTGQGLASQVLCVRWQPDVLVVLVVVGVQVHAVMVPPE